ncbi:hypothetical protein GLAREA_08439 [Glarea lozoyensis ATCC 20868]|uniref:Uncharacterized protein n=1 Tax=Glarea lozoyensis (strain ATCC 20868 / MF5171) TaxID=1116229 RepID=S3CDI3_GLAL2|nr:uncharacterized protein GLAREA_08439 [Glarea lozoyensis ATCC 20868]EPE24587.1 hypothetical protein GLAREA_08439 [Glarea lozoyensis ATCC 20868]
MGHTGMAAEEQRQKIIRGWQSPKERATLLSPILSKKAEVPNGSTSEQSSNTSEKSEFKTQIHRDIEKESIHPLPLQEKLDLPKEG